MTDPATAHEPPTQPPAPQPAAARAKFPVVKSLVLLGVTALVLWAVVAGLTEQGEVLEAFMRAPAWVLLIATAISTVQMFISVLRWQLVLRAVDCRVGFSRVLRVVLACWPLAVVTPSRASDLIRAWLLRDRLDPIVGAGTVIGEKVVDLFSLSLMGTVGMFIAGKPLWGAALLCMNLGVVTGVLLVRYQRERFFRLPGVRKIAPKLERLAFTVDGLMARPGLFAVIVCTSITSWTLAGTLLAVLLHGFGADVPWYYVLGLWPPSIFAGIAVPTAAGMGGRDAAFVMLLTGVGLSIDRGAVLAATLGYALYGAWLWVIVGLPVMVRTGAREYFKAPQTPPEASTAA
jgi:uncharacterized membrane protein YbhN (UPF0104 family)